MKEENQQGSLDEAYDQYPGGHSCPLPVELVRRPGHDAASSLLHRNALEATMAAVLVKHPMKCLCIIWQLSRFCEVCDGAQRQGAGPHSFNKEI